MSRVWPGISLSLLVVSGFPMSFLPLDYLGFLAAWWLWGSWMASPVAQGSFVSVPSMRLQLPAFYNLASEIMQSHSLHSFIMTKSKACLSSRRGDINHTSPGRSVSDMLYERMWNVCSSMQDNNSAELGSPWAAVFSGSHILLALAYVLNASKHESKLLKKKPSGEPLAMQELCAKASHHQG